MIEVYPLRFLKGALKKAPREEIVFHLILAQISNDIVILRKQTMLAANSIDGDEILDAAAVTVAHLNIRLLAGRLYEGAKILRTKEAGAAHKSFESIMDVDSLVAHAKIMKYFGSNNLVKSLRHAVAFHFNYNDAASSFDKFSDEEPFVDYVSVDRGNSLYYSGAILIAQQMADLVGSDHPGEAIDRIFDETEKISVLFEEYANGFMLAFMERHVDLTREMFEDIRTTLPNQPDIRQAKLHYFLDSASLRASERAVQS